MALVSSAYQAELLALFEEMRGSVDETLFAVRLVQATVSFVAMGVIGTVDAGTVSAGAYSGAGTLSPVAVEDVHSVSDIQAACDEMYSSNRAWGDAMYAYVSARDSGASEEEVARLEAALGQAEASAMSGEDMMLAICGAVCDLVEEAVFEIPSVGTVSFTGGSSALSGVMEGSFSGDRDGFYGEVMSACRSLSSLTSGGDEFFAQAWAEAFYAYLVTGVVSARGTGVLEGAVGAGTLS